MLGLEQAKGSVVALWFLAASVRQTAEGSQAVTAKSIGMQHLFDKAVICIPLNMA